MRVEWRRQKRRAARRKDYQLQECLGICVRPGRAIEQNKIPVIEKLSIARDNGDGSQTERKRDKTRGKQLLRSLSLHAVINV